MAIAAGTSSGLGPRAGYVWVAAALAVTGLGLPPQPSATTLVGAASPLLEQVVVGIWLFKLLLLLHSALLIGLSFQVARAHTSVPAMSSAATTDVEPSGRLILAALLAVALALRLYDLGDGLWYDEIRTLTQYAMRPVRQIVAVFDSQNQHLLYSLLARLAVLVFGENAWAVRLPAAVLGVASLYALYWFGTKVTDRREALLATALLTFSYHHVWFSQNARGYTGLMTWTLIASGLLLQMLNQPQTRGIKLAAGYGATMALAIFTHLTAAIAVAAHALVTGVLAWKRRRLGDARWVVLTTLGFVLATTFSLQLYATVLPQLLRTVATPTMAGVSTDWKNPLWFMLETLRGLSLGIPGGWLGLAAGAAVGAAGLISYARRSGTAAAVMVGPAVLTVAALLATGHNLWPRFLFFAGGFAALIAVRGLFALARWAGPARANLIATVVAIALITASASTVPAAWQPKQDFAGARDYIESVRSAGDAVVTLDMSGVAFGSYGVTDWKIVRDAAELEAIEHAHPRTWILYSFPTRLAALYPEIWKRLQQDYTTSASFAGTVGGGDIVVKVLQ